MSTLPISLLVPTLLYINSLRLTNSSLQTSHTSLQTSFATLQSTLQTLQTTNNNLQITNRDLQDQLNVLERKHTSLIRQKEREREFAVEEFAELNREYKRVVEKLAVAEKELEEMRHGALIQDEPGIDEVVNERGSEGSGGSKRKAYATLEERAPEKKHKGVDGLVRKSPVRGPRRQPISEA
ncbi:hypothetical protein HK097_000949 [Rhizophlyctis rosea]|uniref:Uncharacterized protein n=1 Tax=Rhizophlyctis rosea TaxID=64517 RepID=A0AAD5WZ67_9FUNG|nr:hypothetical protein HK097_000949 [Rhizophlyctis rosea]